MLLQPFLVVQCQWAEKAKGKEATLIMRFVPFLGSSLLQAECLHRFGHSLLRLVHGHPQILVLILGELKFLSKLLRHESFNTWFSNFGVDDTQLGR